MKVHWIFYEAALAEWNVTGWQHHMGKNTLENFENVGCCCCCCCGATNMCHSFALGQLTHSPHSPPPSGCSKAVGWRLG